MTTRFAATISGLLILGMTIAAVWAAAQLPAGARVPIHWNIDGVVDQRASVSSALGLLPGIAAVLFVATVFLPRIDPRGANLLRSPTAYGTIWIALTVFFAALQGQLIAAAFGAEPHMLGYVTALVGGLFVVIGNVMGKLRWNYTVGIRTPWAIANEEVWDKTHRFGGWVFVIGGFVLLASAFLLPEGRGLTLMTLAVAASIVIAVSVKSYLTWRQIKDES
jgi:uncharacterized membrane protein